MWQPWGLTPTARFRFRNCGDIQKYEKGTQAMRLGALASSSFPWFIEGNAQVAVCLGNGGTAIL